MDDNLRVYVVWSDYHGEIIGFASSLEVAFEMAAGEVRLQEGISEVYGFKFIEEKGEVNGTSCWTMLDDFGYYEDYIPNVIIYEEILDQPLLNRTF